MSQTGNNSLRPSVYFMRRGISIKIDFNLMKPFLQVDAEKIQENTSLFPQLELNPIPFKPYVDDFNSDPFLPKDPLDMIESGEFNDVPLIMGNNKDEGLMTAMTFYSKPELLEELSRRWHEDLGPLFIATRQISY